MILLSLNSNKFRWDLSYSTAHYMHKRWKFCKTTEGIFLRDTNVCTFALIPAYYSFYRPRKDERLSWPSLLTYSGWLTHISGQPSAAGRAQDRESSPARDRRATTVLRHQLFGKTTEGIFHLRDTNICTIALLQIHRVKRRHRIYGYKLSPFCGYNMT